MKKTFLYIFIFISVFLLSACTNSQNRQFDYTNIEKYQKQIQHVQNKYKNISFTTEEELKDDDSIKRNNPIVITKISIKDNKYKKEIFYTPHKNKKQKMSSMGEIYGDFKKQTEYSHFKGLDFLVEDKNIKEKSPSKMYSLDFCNDNMSKDQCRWNFIRKTTFENEKCSLFENSYQDIKGNTIKLQSCYSEEYGLIIYHSYFYNDEKQTEIITKDIAVKKVKNKDVKPPRLRILKTKNR